MVKPQIYAANTNNSLNRGRYNNHKARSSKMQNQKEAKRGRESSKSKTTPENANEESATPSNVLMYSCHNYTATVVTLTLAVLRVTPLNSPALKKLM